MPSTGFKFVGIGNDLGGGTAPLPQWSNEGAGVNPGNMGIDDGNFAAAELNQSANIQLFDNTVKLTLDGGSTVVGDEQASAIALPTGFNVINYPTNLDFSLDSWGYPLTPADVNSANFGIVAQWIDDDSDVGHPDQETTNKLLAKTFGFDIPLNAIITALRLRMDLRHEIGVANTNKVLVDFITMDITYTLPPQDKALFYD